MINMHQLLSHNVCLIKILFVSTLDDLQLANNAFLILQEKVKSRKKIDALSEFFRYELLTYKQIINFIIIEYKKQTIIIVPIQQSSTTTMKHIF